MATVESVPGIRGLVGHLEIGLRNTALNQSVQPLSAFTLQPLDDLKAARVCAQPAHRTLREKFARFNSNPFCPHCLSENGYFNRAWRHGLVTACPKHGCELVDTCPNCDKTIDFGRTNAFFCDCGQPLVDIKTRPTTPASIWVASRIAGDNHVEPGWPSLGNIHDDDWQNIDELIFLFGRYSNQKAENQSRYLGKFRSVGEAAQFVELASNCLENFPAGFEQDIKQRLATGDQTKAGLANRLGSWFREFRKLTQGSYLELRTAFACSVAENFDGHDSKNA